MCSGIVIVVEDVSPPALFSTGTIPSAAKLSVPQVATSAKLSCPPTIEVLCFKESLKTVPLTFDPNPPNP